MLACSSGAISASKTGWESIKVSGCPSSADSLVPLALLRLASISNTGAPALAIAFSFIVCNFLFGGEDFSSPPTPIEFEMFI